jgi:hypothetical protein
MPDGQTAFQRGEIDNLPFPEDAPALSVIRLARKWTETVVNVFGAIVQDPTMPPFARLKAGNLLLDRGFGLPVQPIDVAGSIDHAHDHQHHHEIEGMSGPQVVTAYRERLNGKNGA